MARGVALRTMGSNPEFSLVDEDVAAVPGEVRLTLVAAPVTPLDTQIAAGEIPSLRLPLRPGSAAVGLVARGGDDQHMAYVAGGAIGMGTRRSGTLAEVFTAPEDLLVAIPDGVDPIAVVAGAGSAATARLALLEVARVEPGERVLVLGAGGSVGAAAASLAGHLACQVVAATRQPEAYSGAGIAVPIDDLTAATLAATEGRGADVIIDTVGGPYLDAAVLAGARRCRHVLVGYAAGRHTGFTIPLTMISEHHLIGFNVNLAVAGRTQEVMTQAIDDIAYGRVDPEIGPRFTLDQVADAYAAVSSSPGRVILIGPGGSSFSS